MSNAKHPSDHLIKFDKEPNNCIFKWNFHAQTTLIQKIVKPFTSGYNYHYFLDFGWFYMALYPDQNDIDIRLLEAQINSLK